MNADSAETNECGEENESRSTLSWFKTRVLPWLQFLKDLILQIYRKLNPKSKEDEEMERSKCQDCGYIIGRSNLDYMMWKQR